MQSEEDAIREDAIHDHASVKDIEEDSDDSERLSSTDEEAPIIRNLVGRVMTEEEINGIHLGIDGVKMQVARLRLIEQGEDQSSDDGRIEEYRGSEENLL